MWIGEVTLCNIVMGNLSLVVGMAAAQTEEPYADPKSLELPMIDNPAIPLAGTQ
jgi:hypothetical protein